MISVSRVSRREINFRLTMRLLCKYDILVPFQHDEGFEDSVGSA